MRPPDPSSSPPPGGLSPARRVARLLLAPVERFLAVEASSGIVLLAAAAIALVWANSPLLSLYEALWASPIPLDLGVFAFARDLRWWVNDGLMTIFFFVVGLEIRREMHAGELSQLRRAALPLAAALGGRVELSPITEVGLVYVERTEAGLTDPLVSSLQAPGDRIPATQWHQDHITELPDGAVVLLTNSACRVQAFRVGEHAYGLQMHPEVDADAFDGWSTEHDDALERSGRTGAQAAAEVRAEQGALIAAWRPMILGWAELVWAYATDRR